MEPQSSRNSAYGVSADDELGLVGSASVTVWYLHRLVAAW